MTTTAKRVIHVCHSPDPDDAFMFHALANNKIPTGDLSTLIIRERSSRNPSKDKPGTTKTLERRADYLRMQVTLGDGEPYEITFEQAARPGTFEYGRNVTVTIKPLSVQAPSKPITCLLGGPSLVQVRAMRPHRRPSPAP